MNTLLHMFNYTFIIRAFIVGLLISLCAAMLGVNLVLRKNAMISDGLSHVSFGSFAIATVLGVAPLYLAVPVAYLNLTTIIIFMVMVLLRFYHLVHLRLVLWLYHLQKVSIQISITTYLVVSFHLITKI